MRRLILWAFLLLATVGSLLAASGARAADVDLVLFYGRGCPHCAAMRDFLETERARHPQIRLHEHEVYFDPAAARLFEKTAAARRVEISGVPTLFVGDRVFVGFAEEMEPDIDRAIRSCIDGGCRSPLAGVAGSASAPSLTLGAVVLAAAVDAVNPCAFAVLILLMTAVLAAGDRRRALAAGLAFSASIFLSYWLMGIGLYSAVEAAGVTRTLYVGVGVLAILIGLFNLKDWLWYGRWFLMEVPLSWRSSLKRLIGGVTSPLGAFVIGFAVSLFLLPCTSGPYVVILGLLAETTTRSAALGWLLLYNAVFVSPMLAITAAIHFGFTTAERAEAWRTRHLRTLHLVAGIVLLALGVGMLAAIRFGVV